MFLDDLLTSYGQMETSFTEHLYQFYKGFEFRSLWNVDDTLAHFVRAATEAAPGTGSLQGVLQLTKALQEIDSLENKGRQCFTTFRYTTNTHKWSFDSVTHAAVCMFATRLLYQAFAHAYIFKFVHVLCFNFMLEKLGEYMVMNIK